ncbi:TDP-N-acetylfucosamine:lipid II N-acetylfucosaminyltransferase [Anoxynatronum buryatiense]|uniref:4-alpha-L-fucosyltransferase glycosyl transferase group 56 n=1 Tax=Anoxynatronum buryatiense TaxID=489973 RepID=A0AA45WVC4_9CLOT|nr:TDP-N-acetylfucosamine:lipid II N-acetylfucosaminyltransferase [Anoxynatronum buryatiense]SMP52538.1 4-alpha-L-fucosyltransferase glycosyl transferase group 56 [Anoxynatronum buryatiense]
MKIIHLFTASSGFFTARMYIPFIKKHFCNQEHHFATIGTEFESTVSSMQYNHPDIISALDFENYCVDSLRFLNQYDRIVLHSLQLPLKARLLMCTSKIIMDKMIWVAWGYDLYQWKKEGSSIKEHADNYIGDAFRKRIKYFVGIIPIDIEYFNKHYTASTYHAPYVGSIENPLYKKDYSSLIKEINKKNEYTSIMVGHSSTRILKHIDTLNQLKKFKSQNIKIILPLTYGDSEYGAHVERVANRLFPGKVQCIKKHMNREDHTALLQTIDVAIFNTERQIGLGNIYQLLYMNKKVILPKTSAMFNYFKSLQQNVVAWEEIITMDFEDFNGKPEIKTNGEGIKYLIADETSLVKMWRSVFES